MNGDLVEVVQIHGIEEHYPFNFLKVTVRNIANNEEHIQLLITELLYNNKPNLDPTDN